MVAPLTWSVLPGGPLTITGILRHCGLPRERAADLALGESTPTSEEAHAIHLALRLASGRRSSTPSARRFVCGLDRVLKRLKARERLRPTMEGPFTPKAGATLSW